MKVLISGCVAGLNVRWNKQNKAYEDIVGWAKRIGLELVPVCPEDELFGTPRKPIRLRSDDGKVIAAMGSEDVYQELKDKAKEIHERYPDAAGFIGISRSPSCGMSVGVKGLGKTIKAPMHEYASIPSIDVNSLKSDRDKDIFLDRVVRYFTKKSCGLL